MAGQLGDLVHLARGREDRGGADGVLGGDVEPAAARRRSLADDLGHGPSATTRPRLMISTREQFSSTSVSR